MPTQVMVDGAKKAAVKQVGAGTIDVSTLEGAPAQVMIEKIIYDVAAVADCVISWDATAAVVVTTLSGRGTLDFEEFGGIPNNAGAGKTGDIVVAGTGTFMVTFILKK